MFVNILSKLTFIYIFAKNIIIGMQKKIIILFIIFCCGFFYAQEGFSRKQIDSLTNILWDSKFFNNEGLLKLTDLYYQAKEIEYTEGQLRLLTKIVEIKSSNLDFVSALQYLKYMKALSLGAEKYEDYTYANCLEAKIFFLDKNYSQAKKVLNRAERYLYKIEDVEKRRKAKTEIYIYQWYNFEKSKLPKSSYADSLLSISKKLYKESLLIQNDYHRATRVLYSANLVVNSLILLKRYEEAMKYLKIAKREIKTAGEITYLSADYYEAKGDVEYNFKPYKSSSTDSALASYNKAIAIGEKLGYTAKTKELYSKVAEIYGEKKDHAKQASFLEKSSDLKDSIQIKENRGLSEVKPLLYAISNKGDVAETPYQNMPLLYFLSAVALLLIGIGGRKLYLNKNKNQTKNIVKVAPDKDPVVRTNSYNHLINLALKNDSSFYLTFLETYPDFADKLLNINPTIKASDIEYCAYIKLNLDTKQIAVLKNISVRAVEGKKYRIRKKLDISIDENMYIWLSNL